MKKGLTYKQKLFFTIIIGISLIFIVYLILRFTLMEENDRIVAENADLKSQYDTLMIYVQNEPKYRAETKENNAETNKILNCYLGDLSKSWLLHNFEENLKVYKLKTASLTLSDNETYAEIVNDGNPMVLQTTPINISYSVKYKNLIKFISDIRELDDNVAIKSFSVAVDKNNNVLTGSLVFERYSVKGNASEFEEPKIDRKQGVDNIFGVNMK